MSKIVPGFDPGAKNEKARVSYLLLFQLDMGVSRIFLVGE